MRFPANYILAATACLFTTFALRSWFKGIWRPFSAAGVTARPTKAMTSLTSRLDALRPKIESLMEIGGTPGAALGVMVGGVQVYTAAYGHRDVAQSLVPNDQTITPVCSMTKAVTSAALAILVEENKLSWDTLVKDALPSFNINDDILQNHMTLTDLLCHRSGMSWADNLVIGTDNNILVSGKDTMAYLNSQTRLLPFRGQFSYNNMPFELAGQVIEALSHQPFEEFVQARIFDPLGMKRTYLRTPPADLDNVAKCYNVLDDHSVAPITPVKLGDNGFGAPHAGMRSCVSDLLKLYKAFIDSFNDQTRTGASSTKDIPLKQVTQLMSAKIPIDQPSRNEASYAFGWARVQLPGKMGQVGINPGLLPEGMPIVGKGAESRLVIFHQGSLPGALSIVILIPDSESAIVVTTNALALNDVPDWIGQLVLEELLEVPERNDFAGPAKKAVETNLKWYSDVTEELKKVQKNGTSPRDLNAYTGTYWDSLHIFKIVVTVEDGVLHWSLQGLESEKFALTHYQDDVFTWLQPRNELSRRGRWVGSDQGPDFWKVDFRASSDGAVDRLFWAHDNDVPADKYKKE